MKLILIVETFVIVISCLGSSFIGIANREDVELKAFRIVFFVVLVIALNLVIFLGN